MLTKLREHIIANYMTWLETGAWYIAQRLLEILALWILARIIIRLSIRLLHKVIHLNAVKMDDRRRNTLESLFDNVIRYLVYIVFIIMALQRFGFNVTTLLAGAGIAGLAIGFGAQSLIKDVLTGFFILFEDQYGVGDVVKINAFTGTVKTIGLRLTRIQAWTGEVEIIPNGQIQQVTNFSKANSTAVVDIGVSYSTNIDKAIKVLHDVMDRVQGETEDIVGNVQILGIQTLRNTDVVLRVTAECKPVTNFGVQRLIQLRVKEAFDREGIEIPVNQSVVWINPKASDKVPDKAH